MSAKKRTIEWSPTQALALAARVPASDRNGTAGPVTLAGWYEQPTRSGRPAWAYYKWIDGRLVEGPCTYDLDAEKAAEADFQEEMAAKADLRQRRELDRAQRAFNHIERKIRSERKRT